MHKLVLLVLLFFVAMTGTAAAQYTDITEDPVIHNSMKIAVEYWTLDPCEGQMRVELRPTAPNGGMWWGYGPCLIVVNEAVWDRYQAAPWQTCIGIVHEWGHSLGNDHQDTDPNSPMYSGEISKTVVAGCYHAYLETINHYGKRRCGKTYHKVLHELKLPHKHLKNKRCYRELTYTTQGNNT